MKRIFVLLLITVLLVSGIAYINLTIFKTSMNDISAVVTGNEYLESLNKITTFEPIYEFVPVEYKEIVEDIVDKASNDTEIQNIISNQTSHSFDDILYGTNSFNQQELMHDLFLVFDDYAEEIESATNKTIPKEQLRVEFEKRIVGYDLSTKYESVIQKVQNKLTDKQKSFLKFSKVFFENVDNYRMISLASLIISVLMLAIVNLKTLLPLSFVSFILVFLNQQLLPRLFPKLIYKFTNQTIMLNLNNAIFIKAYIFIFLMLIGGALGFFISKRKQLINNR